MYNPWGLKVGDRARIRDWEDMVREFGLRLNYDYVWPSGATNSFVSSMRPFCGAQVLITGHSVESDVVYLEFFDASDNVYSYNFWMLEPSNET